MITVALPKGRLMEETVELFNKKGLNIDIPSKSRKLFFYDKDKKYKFLIVRAQDVATYVEYNAACIGVVGLDVLREHNNNVFELLDLGIGYCKMVVAGKDEHCFSTKTKNIRVATKFVNIAKKHFIRKNINAEIVKLYGSIELAPLLGIADCIVDIVSTGQTLKDNGLKVIEEIFESTAMLIANKTSFYTHNKQIKELVDIIQ